MSKEQTFPARDILLSTTDLNSYIKYANESFCEVAGFSLDEMMGQPHNMVRHPDMPKAAFKDLWDNVQAGKSWMGPVKNRCKNGDYYWVNAFVTPIKDAKGDTFEYQSVRTKLDIDVKNRAIDVYKNMAAGKSPKKTLGVSDFTLVIQFILFFVMALSVLSVALTQTPILIALPMIVLSVIGNVGFLFWRRQYKKLTVIAKGVVDNPVMSYIYSGNKDNLGVLEMAMKMRAAELGAVVGRVSDDSKNVTGLADKSSDCGKEVASILNKQANETDQVASAIYQMSTTVKEIANIVSKAADASQQGLDISNDGQKMVTLATESINTLSQHLENIDEAVDRLIDGTKSIESVLSEISSIADQTNLLALNAAIEAARAGEQGRGFAVVAEEVRALAMRSQKSTEEINLLLTDLRNESSLVTAAMAAGNELSIKCVDITNQTGVSFERIMNEMSDIAGLNTQIAAAVEEQSVVSEQISKSTLSISDMSKSSEESGRQTVVFIDQLLGRLSDQQLLIEQFRR
jgi:methyl-accepting chemotaxis protein